MTLETASLPQDAQVPGYGQLLARRLPKPSYLPAFLYRPR